MKRICLAIPLALGSLFAQELSKAEQESLTQTLGEAGNSEVEFARAVESHLKRFPNSPRRAELERALVKTAISLKDDRRLIQYGESALKADPDNLQLLEPVAAALLRTGEKSSAERALALARHIEQLFQAMYKDDKFAPGSGRVEAKRKDESDRAAARVRLLQARAHGLVGHTDDAIKLAKSSYAVYPSVEAAREAARWLSAGGKDADAIQYLADAFTIAGLRSADPDGANDRTRMAELYRKVTGSDAGLGDVILKAYDQTSAQLAERRAQLRELDPNTQIKDPMRFTLSGLDGDKLQLSSLLGKVVVMDFWATWCAPCRQEHPLYEEVKARFKDTGEVVFVSVDTDEDPAPVKPYMLEQKWTQKVYFEDGLSSLLQISSIPTTIVFGKKGEIVSRMIGFLPDRFVDMLTDRIDDALGRPLRSLTPKKAMSQ